MASLIELIRRDLKNEYMEHCSKFNLISYDFGEIFNAEGKTWKISGITPKARKYPIIVEDIDKIGNFVKISQTALLKHYKK